MPALGTHNSADARLSVAELGLTPAGEERAADPAPKSGSGLWREGPVQCVYFVFSVPPCIAALLAIVPVPAAGAARPSAASRRVVTPSQPHTADLRERIYLEQTIRRLLPEVLLMAATVICFMRVRWLCSASTARPPWTRLRENTERHEK